MASVRLPFGEKTIEISSCAENIVRFRISEDFEPTLYERYNIYRHSSDEAGEVTPDGNGITSGDLTVTLDGGEIVFTTPRVCRRIALYTESDKATVDYFDEKFVGFSWPHTRIIGSDNVVQDGGDRVTPAAPKHLTLGTEGDVFYGLGESSKTRLIRNGGTYLQRVVYGENEIPIPYVMTKSGYGILSNSTVWHGVDVCAREAGELCWYFPEGELDFVIFAGDTMPDILERYTYYAGRPILLPKWGYGLTYIAQYYADEFAVMHDAENFRRYDLPCDAISLEPGWMAKNYDRTVNKKWNIERFSVWDWAHNEQNPPPYYFTSALKRYGFKLHLWLCCNHDFTAAEENLAGNDTDFGIPKWFDHLKAFCCDGADSFKMDPGDHVDKILPDVVFANGKNALQCHNLMQTLYAKEMYYGAAKHRGNIRPMHHYCGGYTGSTAYTASTTGDSGGLANSLAWMLNSGFTGISNITCDMNIHFAESIHYAFFTAWCQLNSWAGARQPWWAGEELEEMFGFYDRLRYRLLPYIYSAAITANLTGMPVSRAMPLVCDEAEVADSVTQYMFGESFLVGAFTDTVYLPEGEEWIDAWTMKRYSGGQTLTLPAPKGRGGQLFIRSGAIIPCDIARRHTDAADPELLHLAVFPRGKSSYCFYEDDGVTRDYRFGARAKTEFACEETENGCRITVGAREGSFDGMAQKRTYKVRVFTDRRVKKVRCITCGRSLPFACVGDWLVFDLPVTLENGAVVEIAAE